MKNKFINAACLLLIIALSQLGCEKGPQFQTYTYPAQTASGINPAVGFPGQNVTITGTNFDTLKGAVKVWFGGILATTVVSNNGAQIVVKVPVNAVSGKVGLQVWTTLDDSIGTFTVLPLPAITSVISKGNIAPVVAEPGDTVYIRGSKFLTTPSDVVVDFNGTNAPNITLLTDSLIKVIAPSGYTAGALGVTFKGYRVAGTPLSPTLPSGDISQFFLKNYMHPLQSIETTTPTTNGAVRWFTPKDWVVTDNIKNHNNGTSSNGGTGLPAGGLDYRPFKNTSGTSVFQFVFGVEAGWGAPAIVNGKVYQTTTLPAGNYRFSTRMRQNGFGSQQVYICAASGNTLPDAANINSGTALGFNAFNLTNHDAGGNDATYNDFSFDFTVAASSSVTLGLVIPNFTTVGVFVRFEYFKLEKI